MSVKKLYIHTYVANKWFINIKQYTLMYFNIEQKQSNTAILKVLHDDTFRNVLKVYSQKTNLINRFILQKKACIINVLSNLLVPLNVLKKKFKEPSYKPKSYKKWLYHHIKPFTSYIVFLLYYIHESPCRVEF